MIMTYKVFGYLGVPKEERVSEATMNDIALQIQQAVRVLDADCARGEED